MKVFILSANVEFTPIREAGERRVVSVFLSRGKGKHNFRCSSCGKIVFQYTGDLDFIFDGAVIPEERATIDALCHRCKVIYRAM